MCQKHWSMAKKMAGTEDSRGRSGEALRLNEAARSVLQAVDTMRVEFGLPPREAGPEVRLAPPNLPPPQKIAWDNALNVGIPVIDAQHQALLELVNRLADHPGADVGSEAITEVLSGLGRSLSVHFDFEEALMYSSSMPTEQIAAHVQAHSRILDDYVSINLAAALGENFTAAEIFARAQDWVVGHVGTFDRHIRDHVPAGA